MILFHVHHDRSSGLRIIGNLLKMIRRQLLLLLLLSPALCAGPLKLDRAELALLLQKPEIQRAIHFSEVNWNKLTPDQLNQTNSSDTLLAQEWVVSNQLLRLLANTKQSVQEKDWATLWQSYTGKILNKHNQPLFSISKSASSLAERWQMTTEQQALLHQLAMGSTLTELVSMPKGQQRLLDSWQVVPMKSKQAFYQYLLQYPIDQQSIPLAIQLLREQPTPDLALRLIEEMSPAQLNLYSGTLRQSLGQYYAEFLRHAAAQPSLANSALPLLSDNFFEQTQTQSMLFAQLGNENSGLTSAAMLAKHGSDNHWQRLTQLLEDKTASPLSRYNALLALQLSQDPKTKPLLKRITPAYQERLRMQMLQ